jgi:ATP phosphoribosyltransferase
MARLKLKFGFPIGSLQEKTSKIFEKSGIPVVFTDRIFKVNIEETELFKSVLFMRPQKMPDSLKEGTIDCCICGLDCVENAGLRDILHEVTRLNFSKKTNNEVDVVLFVRQNFDVESCKGEEIKVVSEYRNLTIRALEEFYPKYKFRVDSIDQTAESMVISGEYDMGVCVTESGDTLRANKLRIVKTILTSHTGLWCRKEDMKSEEFKETIQIFGDMLAGALKAEENELLKMNVSAEKKDQVLNYLSENGAREALAETESPTVSQLADGGYDIEVIVQKKRKFDLVLELRKLGATKIIEIPLNVLMY